MKITKKTFYVLSFTWGILYTTAGCLIALFMIATGHKPKKWGWCRYFEAGRKNWGGSDWGLFFVKDKGSGDSLKSHEFGHALQNCFLGPLMLPLVCLPSTVRYWTRRIQTKAGHPPKSDYDSVWFEGQATRLGREMIDRINGSQGK